MKMDLHTTLTDTPKLREHEPSRTGPSASDRTREQNSDSPVTLAHLALHRFLLDMVALVYEIEPSKLVSKTRGRKEAAFARQVAMYLAHTAGGLSLTAVGRLFERDRTTVAHGCALIEDARDDVAFDRSLAHLESAIACQMEMFRYSNQRDIPRTARFGGVQQ